MRTIKGKKGISEIVGYVLLIVIAISLSLLVYTWLKGQIPKETEKCPGDVSLVISDYSCYDISGVKRLNLTLQNNGLFNIGGFVARVKNVSGGFYYDLNTGGGIENIFTPELKPGETSLQSFSYTSHGSIISIQIEPFVIGAKGKILLCESSVIEQNLEGCS